MGVEVYVHNDAVDISFTGADRFLCFKDRLIVPMDEIDSARVLAVEDVKGDLGWRLAGGYWPGRFATGHFAVRDRKNARQLWCVYRDPEVLVIDTRIERPCRIVLQHPDRHNLAWLIGERIRPAA